jgi:cystathionine beta-lyase
VEPSFYPAGIGSGIKDVFRDDTRLIWCESPGSITMEVEDVPAIVQAAHNREVLVALDNTWSAGVYFDAFLHGVDVTMQALTKYVGGHSDLLMGSVTVKDPELYRRLGATQQLLGSAASPDDCSLALRGMKTMAVRLKHIEASALRIARWLAARREIERVLHPALEGAPGHDLWKRDFTGSTGVFSVVFKAQATKNEVLAFVDGLELFEIGYSWGGVTSLAVAYDFHRSKGRPDYGHRIVRLNIGLEDTDDLLEDLEQCLKRVWGLDANRAERG